MKRYQLIVGNPGTTLPIYFDADRLIYDHSTVLVVQDEKIVGVIPTGVIILPKEEKKK